MTQENPFCTRRVRPGAIPFLFPPGEDAETLVRRLEENGWRGEIVGPHGSGKSALLATLLPVVERTGRRPLSIELHDRQRRLPFDLQRRFFEEPFTLVVVDGYEQLGFWSRIKLKRLCRRRGWGLVATAHATVGLPLLISTAVTPESARAVVDQLLAGQPPPWTEEEFSERLECHGGNMRETLFDLYDFYERRQSGGKNMT
jgi:hypothetical protein